MISPYQTLRSETATRMPWLQALIDQSDEIITQGTHGDLPRWREAIDRLPEAEYFFDGNDPAPVLGKPGKDAITIEQQLIKLHPWRKGPLNIGGVQIDTEWRSDWKWDRLKAHLDLAGHHILDVGCGNGYFGWRMLGCGAASVIGIDPTLVYVMQWLACRHFSGPLPNYVLPLRVEDLPAAGRNFDTVFSMGVLYHRRNPVSHLKRLVGLLRPGGQLVMETLILQGEGKQQLVPEKRYARMRNVWAIPTISQLYEWMEQAGFEDTRTLDITVTSIKEQRSTPWMRFESLAENLDPGDQSKTIEGHPAPLRAALLAFTSS